MILFPNAKINLGLNIVKKLENGYHNIESIIYPIKWCDILEIIPSKKFSFSSSGIIVPGQNNLCIDAYNLLKNDFDIPPVKIHLHKLIPIGAGLGGGSSDAIFTIKGLNSLFNLKLSNKKLFSYSSKLGADCSFFIENKACFASGIGDKIEFVSLDLSKYYIQIIYPNINISTKEAYSLISPITPKTNLKELVKKPINQWEIINDFEDPIFKVYPKLNEIKHYMYDQGALFVSMSGSGSSIFGIFNKKPKISSRYSKFTFLSK